MKNKLKVLLTCTVVALSLSACTNPFAKKEPEQTSDIPVEETVAKISAIPGVEFHVGDSITFDDVATVDPQYELSVMRKGLMGDDGMVSETYECTEEGEVSLYAAVQFEDLESEAGQSSETLYITFNVLPQESKLPDELIESTKQGSWDVTYIVPYDVNMDTNPQSIQLSYDKSVIGLSEYNTSISIVDNGLQPLFVSYVTPDMVTRMKEAGLDIFNKETSFRIIAQMVNAVAESDEVDEDTAEVVKLAGWIADWYESVTTASTEETPIVIYDMDGNEYPIHVITYNVDLSTIGGEVITISGLSYIEYNGNRVMLYIPGTQVLSKVTEDGEEEQKPKMPESYEEFVEHIADYLKPEDFNGLGLSPESYKQILQTIDVRLILGDVTPVLPVEEPEATVVETEDTDKETEDESGVVADVFVTYAQRYPEIYVWPESEWYYSRWVPVITDDTQFNHYIVDPSGVGHIGGTPDYTPLADGTVDGYSGGSTGNAGKASMYSIGNTITWYVNAAGLPETKLDEKNSQTSQTVLINGGFSYYLRPVGSTWVAGAVGTNMYNNLAIKDKTYTVKEAGKVPLTEGTITKYAITYVNTNGQTVTAPYLAVLEVNGEYIACYVDVNTNTLPADENILYMLLSNTVSTKGD